MRYAILLGLLLAAPLGAVEVALSPPGTDGWRPLEFPRNPRHTVYTVVDDEGRRAVKASSDCSVSALYVPAEAVDLQATPHLHWRWKIEQGLRIANERIRAGDDFAARVYVMFRFDPEHASLWEKARHRLWTTLYNGPIPGEAINYVWTSAQPSGTRWDNPFTSASKMVSLGSGAYLQWTEETVDVVADYVSLFADQPPPVLAVAVMTDSDNSCGHAVAYYADFRFLSR